MKTNGLLCQDSNAYQIGRRDGYDEIMSQMHDIIDKCYNTGYKDAMDFACEWICDNFHEYERDYTELESKFDTKEEMMNHFRKTMKEHLCNETSK